MLQRCHDGASRVTKERIGIYSGTFNPVHAGHIAFALQAVQAAKLDRLYFLPERRPRHKKTVEHFGHRVAMLQRAVRPYPNFEVLELDDVSFSMQRTLPNLEIMFPDSQLVFLVGSDAVLHMSTWPHIERLFAMAELVIGRRDGQAVEDIKQTVASWPQAPLVTLINSYAPDVSSTSVREALQTRQSTKGLLKSVAQYSNHHWLYVSLPK
jgi:nicotinate-nucleotide adenylyltransferase